jgi:hypothetical protein
MCAVAGGVRGSVRVREHGVSNRQTEKLVRRLDRVLERSRGVLVERFGEETAGVMRRKMLDEYRRLIPEVPYIGGRRNPYSFDLSFSAWTLAIHRAVVEHGGTVEDTGELVHRMVRAETDRIPQAIRPWMKRYRFSRLKKRQVERAARRSQARRYPGDWVLKRIDGNGRTFDFGIDMTECGIVKFLHTQGADELTPYLCELDYIGAEAMGVGLHRTKTLAWGCDRCDFRLSKHGVTSAPWPPRFLEQTCGEPITESEEPASPS